MLRLYLNMMTTGINKEVIIRKGFGYKDLPKFDLIDEEILRNFEEKHSRYKAVVREILEEYDKATNNDFILYIEVLRVLGLVEATSGKNNFVFKIKREDLKKIPSSESITRARRSLNTKGIGLPTNNAILILRSRKQKALREYFKNENSHS